MIPSMTPPLLIISLSIFLHSSIAAPFDSLMDAHRGIGDLRFFVLGDIGGIPVLDTTFAQKKVAKSLLKRSKGMKAVVNLGDNFYFTGVMSDTDPRFKSRFEDVYKGMNVPWFTIAGNHDHFGDVNAQISYTSKSSFWKFPSSYYKQSFTEGNVTVDFVMIDTIDLCGNSVDVKSGDFFEVVAAEVKERLSGDSDMKPVDEKKAEEQWSWIEKILSESRGDYLFVGGHYPVYSISSHGPTPCLISRLVPLLEKYNVSVYFSGHDHSLQHMTRNGVTYVVSGAASRSDQSTSHRGTVLTQNVKVLYNYPKWSIRNLFSQLGFSDGGFVEMNVKKKEAHLLFLNKNGEVKYTSTVYPKGTLLNQSSAQEIQLEL